MQIGQRVKVKVNSVDMQRRTIDLVIEQAAAQERVN
ncbi:MAG: hypothetical protein ACOYNU_15225 [Bacteroidales bacterium]